MPDGRLRTEDLVLRSCDGGAAAEAGTERLRLAPHRSRSSFQRLLRR